MKAEILAVVQELQRLKRGGVASVAVSDEAIEALRSAVARRRHKNPDAPAAPSEPAAPSADAREENPPAAVSESSIHARYAGSSGQPAAAEFKAVIEAADRAAPSVSMPVAHKTPQAAAAASTLPPPPVIQLPEGTKRERWEWLRDRVLTCETCRAHTPEGCKVVFGIGNIDADIFFCGEAPGADEEQQGEPFVGAAGKLLTKMIAGMGLQREQVYIGNILNWRPQMEARRSGASLYQTGNRPPTEEEMRFGLPYLRAQIEVVQPEVVVALGSTAAQGLLGSGSFKSLGSIRGRWHEFNGTPLMVTYHPSYLLRNQSNRSKRVVWEDLLQVMEKVGLPISEKQQVYFL
ncbi:MAG: uracil-DNA glycosylase family protein [Opitutaceae bacterium]